MRFAQRRTVSVAAILAAIAAACFLSVDAAQIVTFRSPPVVGPRPLTTLDRVEVAAEFLGVDDAGRLKFHLPPATQPAASNAAEPPAPATGLESTVAQDELVAWGTPQDPPRGLYLVLIDGSLVAADGLTCDSENLHAKILSQDRTLPLTQVRGLVFRAFGSQAERDRLIDVVAASRTGDRDRLVMLTGDETAGTVKSIDYQAVTLETALGPAVIELTKLSYLVFNPALAAAPPEPKLRMVVGLRSGSSIVSAPLRVGPAGAVRLQPTALAADTAWDVPLSDILSLQTLGGKSLSLSSLQPTGYRHVPYLNRTWPYLVDRNVDGGVLRAGGRRYAAGLGMHSTSRITYALDGKATRFAASLAIDDSTDGRGSVGFRVFIDGREKYRSPTIRGGDRPTPIEVPLDGGKQLSLVVDFADFADEKDHANWLNPRLLP